MRFRNLPFFTAFFLISITYTAAKEYDEEIEAIVRPLWYQLRERLPLIVNSTECHFRLLSYQFGLSLLPARSPQLDVFDALELSTKCHLDRPTPKVHSWPTFPTPSGTVYYVDPQKGSDTNPGTLSKPFQTIGKALQVTRSGSGKTILLRAGIHYLSNTLKLQTKDSGLTIQNYNGEEAWISGGVPIHTNWKSYNTTTNLTCNKACTTAGHCCIGSVSSFNHPSCEMGCIIAKHTDTEAKCREICSAADAANCEYKFGDYTFDTCSNCPKGCDASDGVRECFEGCQFAHGEGGENVWMTDIGDEISDTITGLMTAEPHERFMRARYPNPRTGTQELRPAGKISGKDVLKWHPPSVLPAAEQVYTNATAISGFDSSTLEHYNAYASGNCKHLHDPTCPCAAWSDVRAGKWSSSSYWCSDKSSGGWSEMDRGNGYYHGPILPQGMTYDKKALSQFSQYKNATGAIIVAWRAQGWFVGMYEVEKHDKDNGIFTWSKGGFQGGRGWQLDGKTGAIDPSPPFFIENVFEELDHPSEWYFDKEEKRLYLWYNTSSGTPPATNLQFISTKLKRLIDITGTKTNPVKNIVIRGLGFRDTAFTYMDPWGVPSGGDWALHRGGAVFVEGSENTLVQGCMFKRLDGNALILSGYNRHTHLDRNEFVWIGDTAMAAWGYTDEHDGTGGEQPRYTTVSNNVCHEVGIFQLQSACWFQAKTALTIIENNLFYNGPRSGINFNDGFGGGNIVSRNLIFNQCRQSGDHGPINSWDRQLFWTDVRDGSSNPGWNPKYSEIFQNVIIANYGGSQGFDNDDGSSWYDIYENVIYGEGLKQDYGGHDSKYHNNLNIVHHYDGQNCINTWPFKLGQPPCGDWSTKADCSHAHRFNENKCIVLYTDEYSPGAGGCPPQLKQMAALSNNHYYTPHGNASLKCGGSRHMGIPELQKKGTELGSKADVLPTDDEWLSWAHDILHI